MDLRWPIAALGLLATACGGKPQADIVYDPATFIAPDNQFSTAVGNDYYLGPTDIVNVSTFELPEVSGDSQVTQTGSIDLPLIGSVQAQGKTTTQLARDIEDKLRENYYQNPKVTVVVKQALSQRLTIDGSVNSPGIYPISGQLTLVQAVALAKGLDEYANPQRIVVFRTIDGRRQAAAFDLSRIREGEQPDPQLYGNDVIVVDGSRSRRLWKDVLGAIPILSIFRPF